MAYTSKKIHKLLVTEEESNNTNAHLQQALAQIEAALSRKENQKISEKSQNR